MYLFYMDESGEREYTSSGKYFVLCSLGVQAKDWKSFNIDILTLKQTYFGDVRVELKSNWLRIPKERQRHYLVPYRITDADLIEFTSKLYDILLSFDVTLISAVIDKARVKAQYAMPQSPSSLAYRLVLERIELFLQEKNGENGIVVFDKITELEMRKKGYENLLARQHLRYLEKGTDFVQVSQIIEGLLFIPSYENNFIQLADLCAYNVYRQFSEFGDDWEAHQHFERRYHYFARIEPKFRRAPGGDYAGYGIKKFP